MRKIAVTANSSERKLHACRGRFWASKYDSLSAEALQTRYKTYRSLPAMIRYHTTVSHSYSWHVLKQEVFGMDIWGNVFPTKTAGAQERLPGEVGLSLSMEVLRLYWTKPRASLVWYHTWHCFKQDSRLLPAPSSLNYPVIQWNRPNRR